MTSISNFKNKKVLVLGLGVLGGGVATANWFARHGAKVTISDLKSADELKPSLDKLDPSTALGTGFQLRLGQQSKKDIDDNDIIVVNPGISVRHELVQYALARGKIVTNEAVLFHNEWARLRQGFGGQSKIIGITGTRGKTTTAHWTAHLMGDQAVLAGNSPEHPFLNQISNLKNQKLSWAVTEVSSFHLELFDKSIRPSDIAVITNIYQDHLNRYASMEEYARTKANLFLHQIETQHLILNPDNEWTKFFESLKPRARILYAAPQTVPIDLGLFEKEWGTHNLANLLQAALAARLAGVSWDIIQDRIATLPQVQYRQEIVYRDEKLTIINDAAATSPEGGVAALRRFGGPAFAKASAGKPNIVLITGGTDRELDFSTWAATVRKLLVPEQIIMLAGSATDKMRRELGDYALSIPVCDSLEDCVARARARARRIQGPPSFCL